MVLQLFKGTHMPGHILSPNPQQDVLIYKCHPDAILPKVQEDGSAGYDLHTIEDFALLPGDRIVVGTGLVIQPPPGFHTEILLRSSMAYKHSIILMNSVGLIDRSYSGEHDELKIMLYRLPVNGMGCDTWDEVTADCSPIVFKKGDRIAQLVFRETVLFTVKEVTEPPGSNRGGFGSTGQ